MAISFYRKIKAVFKFFHSYKINNTYFVNSGVDGSMKYIKAHQLPYHLTVYVDNSLWHESFHTKGTFRRSYLLKQIETEVISIFPFFIGHLL